MKFLMISCRKASELNEKQLAGALAWSEGFQLWMHRRLCDACRRYGYQSHSLDEVLKEELSSSSLPKNNDEDKRPVDEAALPPAREKALQEKILNRLKDL